MIIYKVLKNNKIHSVKLIYKKNELPMKLKEFMNSADNICDIGKRFVMYYFNDNDIKIQEYPNTIIIYVKKQDLSILREMKILI